MQGAEEELKWCLHFSNLEKPLVLNMTNMQLISKITGSENTDDWTGKQIVIYNDPTISMGGRITGGLRVRAPKVRPAAPASAMPPAPRPAAHVAPPPRPAPAPVVEPLADDPGNDDDVPF